MVCTRLKFRAAVRRARKEANSAKAHVLLEAARSGDQALLLEMRRVMGSKHQAQEMPESLEGAVGHGAVVDKFKSLYELLYNSASSEERMGELREMMAGMVDCRDEAEVRRVTPEVVAAACRKMKGGKVDVTEGYTSNVFCHAPPLLYQKLASIFRSYLTHGTITISILSCAFILPRFIQASVKK